MIDESHNLPPDDFAADATAPPEVQGDAPNEPPVGMHAHDLGAESERQTEAFGGSGHPEAPEAVAPAAGESQSTEMPTAEREAIASEPVTSDTASTKPRQHRDGPVPQPAEVAASKAAPAHAIENGDSKKDWYILKVQSNREDAIADGLQRRVAIAGLQDYFGEIIVPTEMVTEFKNGKKRVVKRKLYPGYIVVNMAITDDTWFLVRDTPGIGDFTGSGGKPIPMQAHEVAKLIAKQEEKTEEQPRLKISFKAGDRVKINEGTFENFEGEVENIDETNGRVTVMINIFGRSTPVELEYWQIETV